MSGDVDMLKFKPGDWMQFKIGEKERIFKVTETHKRPVLNKPKKYTSGLHLVSIDKSVGEEPDTMTFILPQSRYEGTEEEGGSIRLKTRDRVNNGRGELIRIAISGHSILNQ